MSRSTVKNRRSPQSKMQKLRAEIEALESRLAKAKAEFEGATDFEICDAGRLLEALVDRVEREGERLYLCKGKKRVASLVPADDAEYLEELEDRHWSEAAKKAMEEPGTIPLEQVKRELGL
jgi:antitoxin (DNA-binding transcriptional repressor) of toxin-antitoxin stability system